MTYLGRSVLGGSGGLSGPLEMVYGSDSNLYIVSEGTNSVKRYNGSTGAYIDDFVSSGSGGLSTPVGMAFGQDGNLYVSSYGTNGTNGILRYNGTSGAFIDNFASGGRIGQPQLHRVPSCGGSCAIGFYHGATGRCSRCDSPSAPSSKLISSCDSLCRLELLFTKRFRARLFLRRCRK